MDDNPVAKQNADTDTDTDGDGIISDEEAEALNADTDGDGVISEAEAKAIVEETGRSPKDLSAPKAVDTSSQFSLVDLDDKR